MMTEDDGEKFTSRALIFDGSAEQWPFFRVNFESHLARLNMSKLLTTEKILKAGEASKEADQKDKDVKERLRKLNKKAAGILLNAIRYETDDGKADFQLISKLHDKSEGYAGGYFYKEWKALVARHKQDEEIPTSKMRQGKLLHYGNEGRGGS